MGVTRYRDAAEMAPPPPVTRDLARRIRELWRRSSAFGAWRLEPGVRRYRSLEELQAAHDAAVIQHMRQLRAGRGG